MLITHSTACAVREIRQDSGGGDQEGGRGGGSNAHTKKMHGFGRPSRTDPFPRRCTDTTCSCRAVMLQEDGTDVAAFSKKIRHAIHVP